MITTFDVETYGFSKDLICGSVAYRDYKKQIQVNTYKTKEELLKRMKEIAEYETKQDHKVQFYAHNADYDSLRLIDINDPQLKIIKASRPGIYAYRIGPEQKLSMALYDSMKILPMSLEKVGKIIGHEKTRPPKELDDKMKSGKKWKLTFEEYNQIAEYNKNDCILLLKALEWIKEECKKEGLKPKELRSIGQISQNKFNMNLRKNPEWSNAFFERNTQKGQPKGYIQTKYSKEIREASRSARFETFQLGTSEHATYIDKKSHYPDTCTEIRIPDLRTEQMIKNPLEIMAIEQIVKQIGVTKCIIEKPADEYGYIPIRLKKERDIIYDQGYNLAGNAWPKQKCTLIGTWTNNELQEYLKKGCKIKAIEYTINYAPLNGNPLGEFMKEMYEKRQKSEHTSQFYKLIMNNLTGRFSYQKTDDDIEIDNINNTPEWERKGYTRGERDQFNCLYYKESEKKPSYYYAPIISALIYSEARMIMQREIEKIPAKDLLYMANDSIMTNKDYGYKFDIGENMGQFGYVEDDEGKIIDRPTIIYGIDNYMIGNLIKLNGIHKSYATKEQFMKKKIKYTQMYTLANAPEPNMAGTMHQKERDLTKTITKAIQRQEDIERMTQFRDKYTDCTWFEQQGYI